MSFLKPNTIFRVLTISRSRFNKNALRRNPIRVLNVPQSEVSTPEPNFPKADIVPGTFNEKAVSFPAARKSELFIPSYEKILKTDHRLTKTLTVMKNRKMRELKGKMLLEGKRLINDAIDAGIELETLYFTREKDLADIKWQKAKNPEVFKVLYKTLKVWSDLTTCPGVMGVFKRPDVEVLRMVNDPVLPVTILCDNIRDPGNLGSIIRNAAAAGCESVFLMKGCVDPWETKVLRAGCGGHFRVPIVHDIEWSTIGNYLPQKSTIFIADNEADIEGSAVSSEFIHFDEIEGDTEEPKKYFTTNEHGQSVVVDEEYNEPNALEKYEDVYIPSFLYSSIKYPKHNIVLYVGGETHGVDPKIVKLSCEFGGKRIKIPLEHNMESLNSSFAMTIVLYEIKRQFSETYVTK